MTTVGSPFSFEFFSAPQQNVFRSKNYRTNQKQFCGNRSVQIKNFFTNLTRKSYMSANQKLRAFFIKNDFYKNTKRTQAKNQRK